MKDRKLKADPHYPAAVRRAKEAAQRLRDAGIIDAAGRRIRDQEDARRQKDQERKSDTPHCCGVATNPRTLPVAPHRSALAAGSRPARSES